MLFSSDPLETPGVHEKEIKRFFKGNVQFDGDAPVFDEPLYLLAFSNRSGSNLLASYLRATPYFGGFHEQLIHSTVTTQATDGACETFPDYIRWASTNYGQGYKTWGFKASWDQIMMLYRFGINRMYPSVRIIHITRRDLVDQAVSYLIASQTKKWTSAHDGDAGVEPAYDYATITKLMQSSASAELQMRMISVLFDVPYTQVRYEALVRRPEFVMDKIGQFANIDLSKWKPKEPPITKQANALNQEFYDRYILERKAALLGNTA